MKTIYIRKLPYSEAKHIFLSELEKCFFSGEERIEVVHGIGEYVLRNMVFAEVAKIDYAQVRDSDNPGISIVELDLPEESMLKKYRG